MSVPAGTPRLAALAASLAAENSPKQCLVAIDRWKRPIFERHLSGSGYRFTVGPGLDAATLFLKVTTTNVDALAVVIRAAELEAHRTGAPKP